jgi:type IV secretion system protein VirD4
MIRMPSAASKGRAFKIAVSLGLGVVVALYVSGYLFLWTLKENPREASPLTVIRYAYYYGDRPEVAKRLKICTGFGFGAVALFGALLLIPKKRPLHGDARWMRKDEIERAGLLAPHGIILGDYRGRYLTLGGQQGVLLAAPPRSGKGVGVVIPNLLNWSDSVIAVDIKMENFQRTAGFRAHYGQEVHLLDLALSGGRGSRWNPLDYVSADPNRRIDDLQRIAVILYPDAQDMFWIHSARTLFLGIALYLFERREAEWQINERLPPDQRVLEVPVTLGEILRQGMPTDDDGFGEHWKRIIDGRAAQKRPLSSECVRALHDVIGITFATASSIRKTFTSGLDLWLNPRLDAATSASDFDLRDLRKRPMSIYVGVNPDDLGRLRPVLNLFFQQAIGLQTRERPETNPALKHQVLMILDEFTALGKIPILVDAQAYLPGYNVRILMVIQTLAQFHHVYGRDAAAILVKTLGARIVFPPNSLEEAREISEELGNTTVNAESISRPGFGFGKNRGRTVNESAQRRPLLLPQEVKGLGPTKAMVFYDNLGPVLCKRIRYFEDPNFAGRELPPPPLPTVDVNARARGIPDRLAKAKPAPAATKGVTTPLINAADGRTDEVAPARPFSASHVGQLAEMTESSFSFDFESVPIPEGRSMSEAELHKTVDQFLAQIAG